MNSENKTWEEQEASAPDVQGIATHTKTLTKTVELVDLTNDNDEVTETKDLPQGTSLQKDDDSKKVHVIQLLNEQN